MRPEMFRIGCVPYLNARPLVTFLEGEETSGVAECVYDTPARLSGLLRERALDAAIVSSIEALRRPGFSVVPDISIAADGAVRSVRLLSRKPLKSIRSLALDDSSLTSVALCRILLAEQHGVRPTCLAMKPDLPAMLAQCDAALLIGDAALACESPGYELDLGDGWQQLTGRPFVYAAWMLAGTNGEASIVSLLSRAKEWGLERLRQLALDWSDRTGLSRDITVPYLTAVMQYDLDEPKKESLRVFGELCMVHGLLEDSLPLRLSGVPSLGHTR